MVPRVGRKLDERAEPRVETRPLDLVAVRVELPDRAKERATLTLVAPQRRESDGLPLREGDAVERRRHEHRMRARFDEDVHALLRDFADRLCEEDRLADV